MNVTRLMFPEVMVIEPDVYKDDRGFFYESFNQDRFNNLIGKKISFVQDNISFSNKGVLRGIHFQLEPFAQGKLVSVLNGEVFDVVVDIRKKSSTFGKFITLKLSKKNKKQLWIPEGFAHGFLALTNKVVFCYKVTNFYNKKYEKTIIYDDMSLNIPWPKLPKFFLSEKDRKGKSLKNLFKS